ncbi:hypothetical protein SAMN05660826_00983 [Caldanaerovirga acetigignens]|uniref:DUF192 domain-containing protein n=1 Tax=Caldanaerovirga acetigignens TaxID=447595 RepID=A0A1M7IPF3_9FIRM|nr:hypothetical protein SAMN05660826_00983 [Caldanaerovirga acetigignens]
MILAEKVDSVTGIRRFIGLIGRKHLASGDGLLLMPCQGVHTYFMRFYIDAVYLDENGRVVRVVNDMPPYTLGPVLKRARAVLELAAGTCRKTGTEEGDLVEFLQEGDEK